MSRKSKTGEVFLPNGAFKINPRTGKPEKVASIIAQEPSSCCGIDCCDNTIKWVSKVDGLPKSISLDDILALLP